MKLWRPGGEAQSSQRYRRIRSQLGCWYCGCGLLPLLLFLLRHLLQSQWVVSWYSSSSSFSSSCLPSSSSFSSSSVVASALVRITPYTGSKQPRRLSCSLSAATSRGGSRSKNAGHGKHNHSPLYRSSTRHQGGDDNDNFLVEQQRRRQILLLLSFPGVLGSSLLMLAAPGSTAAATSTLGIDEEETRRRRQQQQQQQETQAPIVPVVDTLTEERIDSFVYEGLLGTGSYKTVYLVSSSSSPSSSSRTSTNDTDDDYDDDDDEEEDSSSRRVKSYYALAVEKLQTQRAVKNAMRGVQIPLFLQQQQPSPSNTNTFNEDQELFETILDWWIQPSDVTDYRRGQPVFGAENNKRTLTSQQRGQQRRGKQQQAPSKNFRGARWMISIKPVYNSLSSLVVSSSTSSASSSFSSFGGTPTNDDDAVLQFVVDVVHAGARMHAHGILHRDLKPQHILLSAVTGRPVLLDFGYAEYGRPRRIDDDDDVRVLGADDDDDRATPKPRGRLQSCAVQPGQRKGEVAYVRADDLAQYRGCQRGDTYAMGKTLYELFLDDGPHAQTRPETTAAVAATATLSSVSFLEQAQTQNRLFWDLLYGTSNNTNNDNNSTGDKHHPLPRGRLETLLSDETSLFLLSLIQGLCRPNNPVSFEEAEQALRSYISKEKGTLTQKPTTSDN